MRVRLHDVGKAYRAPGGVLVVLKGVELEVEPGRCMLLTGPPGSGKSTLLSIVGALLRPTVGEVWLGERRTSHLPEHVLARLRLRDIGFVFQGFRLLRGLTAADNVELALAPRGLSRAERRQRAQDALASMGLEGRGAFRVNDLSGGEQQRVAVARALVGEPRLLLADEPTASADRATAEVVLERLRERKQAGASVWIASHDETVGAVPGLVDVRARLEAGRLVELG